MAEVFASELAFEDALVEVLEKDYGWRYLHIIQELENKDVDLVMRSLTSLV